MTVTVHLSLWKEMIFDMLTLIKSYRYRVSDKRQQLFTVSKPRKVGKHEGNDKDRFA